MSVAFGFPEDARVATPAGEVALGRLREGDVVWAVDPLTHTRAEARIAGLSTWASEHLVAVHTASGGIRGCTPGTNLWDAFEEGFRAAGSLSSLSEVLVDDGAGGLRAEPVLEVPERVERGASVHHLTLARPHGTLIVDGVVVRHKEAG